MNSVEINASFDAAGVFLLGGGAAKVSATSTDVRLDVYVTETEASELAQAFSALVKDLGGYYFDDHVSLTLNQYERRPIVIGISPRDRMQIRRHAYFAKTGYVCINDGSTDVTIRVNRAQASFLSMLFFLSVLHIRNECAEPVEGKL